MSYSVRLSKQIKRQIAHLPGDVRNVAKRRIVALRREPRPADAKELDGHPSYFRLWLDSDFRLVWSVDDDSQVVDIYYVGPKSPGLYEQLGLGRA